MNGDDAIVAATNIGFAIATIRAFMIKPGVSSEMVKETLERLDVVLELIAEHVEPPELPSSVMPEGEWTGGV